jgi:hypothetical protein
MRKEEGEGAWNGRWTLDYGLQIPTPDSDSGFRIPDSGPINADRGGLWTMDSRFRLRIRGFRIPDPSMQIVAEGRGAEGEGKQADPRKGLQIFGDRRVGQRRGPVVSPFSKMRGFYKFSR